MKKINSMVLVLAGTIGCGMYASEQREPKSPRTEALDAFETTLDINSFDAKHLNRMIRLKDKIDREFENMEKRQRQEVESCRAILALITRARKTVSSESTKQ